jgi:uncharacterized membrane protein
MYEKLMTLRNTTTWHLCVGSWLPGNCRTISHKHASPHFRENRRKKQMQWAIVIAAFLASAVEFVEAFTLVLVAGITVNWRSAIVGALAAVATLAVIIATLGVTLVTLVPIAVLRFVIGFLLLLFGLKWLKNAIQRYSGLKLLHDEEAIYAARVAEARARGEPVETRLAPFGVLLSYKSVLLEGLEVAFIVISFGGSGANGIGLAALGAAAAGLLVIGAGTLVQAPLQRIPENTLKFIVGIMLTTFGTFWSGESFGINWPFSDLFLLLLALIYLVASILLITAMKQLQSRTASATTSPKTTTLSQK